MTICKIFASDIKIGILMGLLSLEEAKNRPIRIIASKLAKICKFKRIPSEDLDFICSPKIGLINSEKKGIVRYISLNEKGRNFAKILNELEGILKQNS